MKPKIIYLKELEEKNYGETKITTIINNKKWPFFSIAKIKKVGNNVKLGYDTESNTIYYVLDGEGDCVINGKTYYLKKGDCVVYPQGTKYKHLKGLTLLAISTPRFNRAKRIYVE